MHYGAGGGAPRALRVPEERHESEVHVQLLVAVKERQARIVGEEVELELLEPPKHHDILHDAGGRFARDTSQLEAVTVQVQRVGVVALIVEDQAVAFSCLDHERIGPGK